MNIKSFLSEIADHRISLHNFMIWQDGKIIARGECPQTPLDAPHRLYSISKTLAAIAIGLLYSQGRLELSDPIVKYFPDKLKGDPDPRLAATTIRDMLMMRTCHSLTTYKQDPGKDWVGSFFTVTPDHYPGTLWHYDTSSAHVLGALVERLSGLELLDFVRERLPGLELSGEAYFLKDEMGVPMGGTGLVATPRDAMALALLMLDARTMSAGSFIVKYGGFGFDAGSFQDFLQEASSKLSPTTVLAKSRFESFGYGYMTWRTDHDGFMLYGMGGQFAAVYPEKNTILVTTADTQYTPDGNDVIFDSFYKYVLMAQKDEVIHPVVALSLPVIDSPAGPDLEKSYNLEENASGFTSLTVTTSSDKGTISLKGKGRRYVLSFGTGRLISGIFSNYDLRCHGFGVWETSHMLYLRFYVTDSYMGTVHLELSFSPDYSTVSVFMKKVEESLFQDFEGHLRGSLA